MRDQLQNECAADIRLIAGGGGIFTVVANGVEIFSKREVGHFPEAAEIINLMQPLK